ncbi:hypothetical protein HKX48_001403 [Thoreauomyces humboldtii]|nr:hypothetical protein HKX48_001403 [Thoreauomyces humboldtii]
MAGSVTSSRSNGSRSSAASGMSTTRGTGFSERMAKKYKGPFFSLLVTLVKDSEHNRIGVITLIGEWFQLLNFAFDGYNWGTTPGTIWVYIMSVFQFENIMIRDINYTGLLSLVGVVLALTLLLVWLSYYVFSGFFKGSFKAGIGPVRMLRGVVSALLTVGFLPLYVPLLAVFNCRESQHNTAGGYPACTDPLNLVFVVLAFFGILILLPFTFLATMTYFKPNSKSNSWSAKPNPRLELSELMGKVILATIAVFVRLKIVRAIVLLLFACWETFSIWSFVPYYRKQMNFLKFILSVELVWASICLFPVAIRDNDATGGTAMIVFFCGTPFAAGLGFLGMCIRWNQLEVFPRLASEASDGQAEAPVKTIQDVELANSARDKDILILEGIHFRYPWMVALYTRPFLHDGASEDDVRRAELVYRRGMELFPDDGGLLVSAALFFTAYRGDTAMAIMLCQKVLKSNPPIDVEFTVFYLRRGGIFESANGGPRLDLVDQLDFKHLNKRAKNYHEEAKRKIGLFWKQLLLDQSQRMQLRMLNDLASQINKAERRAAGAYEQLCNRFPMGRHWIAYANFIEEVQHNVKRADEIYAQYEAAQAESEEPDDGDEHHSSAGGSDSRKGSANVRNRRGSSITGKVMRLAGQTKKERKAYREYHRQITSLKSIALQRMGAITKGLILVLILVVLGEFVYGIEITKVILSKIDTVISSGYRREAAISIPAAVRSMEDAALAGNTTLFYQYQAAASTLVQPLDELQKVLFYDKMRDSVQMNLWTNNSIMVTELRNVGYAGNNTYATRYVNLFDASTMLTSCGTFTILMPPDEFVNSTAMHNTNYWYWLIKNAPNAVASAYSVATYDFVLQVKSQTLNLFSIQEAILCAIGVAVLLTGLLLFSPTMRKVEAERELSLKSFTKIPRSVAENIYHKYTHGLSRGTNDDDDFNNSDSEEEEEEGEDAGGEEEIDTSHAAVYRRMSQQIWVSNARADTCRAEKAN